MKIHETKLAGVKLLEPKIFSDSRGWFAESFNQQRYAALGMTAPFVQDNRSRSRKGVLRGLHFQSPESQGKLVQVLYGKVYDVVVDIRPESPTFGQWEGFFLDGDRFLQLWVPRGFAHGFEVLSEEADFSYKVDNYWHPECESGIRFDDPQLAIPWHASSPDLSPKDLELPFLSDLKLTPTGT